MPANYFSVVTLAGQAVIANAIAGVDTVHVAQLVAGDGNGAPTTPVVNQTQLVHEVWRGGIISGGRDPAHPTQVVIRGVIPGTIGPATVREIGVLDSDGQLIAVGSYPAVDVPGPGMGAVTDIEVTIVIAVDTAAPVTVVVDHTTIVHLAQMRRVPFMPTDGIRNTPPANPGADTLYVTGAQPTGAWAGWPHHFAQWASDVWQIAPAHWGTIIACPLGSAPLLEPYWQRTVAGWSPIRLGGEQSDWTQADATRTDYIAHKPVDGYGVKIGAELPLPLVSLNYPSLPHITNPTLDATIAVYDAGKHWQMTLRDLLRWLVPKLPIAPGTGVITITPATLPAMQVGTAIAPQQYVATGGAAPYTWAVAGGALPAGLALNVNTGIVSGTPTTAGTGAVTLRATDSLGASGTVTIAWSVAAAGTGPGVAITITPSSLPPMTVGTAMQQPFAAAGGAAPYTWAVISGALPPGLALNAATGVVSGTPTTAGTYSFTLRATDANGYTGTRVVSGTVSAAYGIGAQIAVLAGINGVTLPAGQDATTQVWAAVDMVLSHWHVETVYIGGVFQDRVVVHNDANVVNAGTDAPVRAVLPIDVPAGSTWRISTITSIYNDFWAGTVTRVS